MSQWIVTQQESGLSLMHFVKQRLKDQLSVRSIKNLIERGCCLVDGCVERFGSRRLASGETVSYLKKDKVQKPASFLEVSRILLEDEAILCYNKPPNLSTCDGGLEEQMLSYDSSLLPVHRLDKDTSGVVLFAKGKGYQEILQKAFKERDVEKEYYAIVSGRPKEKKGVIDFPLAKIASFQGGVLFGKSKKGQWAVTEWECIQSNAKASLFRCRPKTGRTHQIRVHLAEIGHPVLGDYFYGKSTNQIFCPARQMLHACAINFFHPLTSESLRIAAAVPDDFVLTLDKLGLGERGKNSHR